MQKYIKKVLGLGTTTLIISNDEMKYLIKMAKSLEDFSLLPEEVSETIHNEAKEQRGGFLSMLLGTLGASLLGNILAGRGINGAKQGVIRAIYGNKMVKKGKIIKTKWIFNAASSFN